MVFPGRNINYLVVFNMINDLNKALKFTYGLLYVDNTKNSYWPELKIYKYQNI